MRGVPIQNQADLGRSVLPHKDPVFDAVTRLLDAGAPAVDWRITGPSLVKQAAGIGLTTDQEVIDTPELVHKPVTLNLMPDVAREVLRHLGRIAERQDSRTGRSHTYRMKKAPAVEVAASGEGHQPNS